MTTVRSPLEGRRVLVTRAEEQAGPLVDLLRRLGAEPVLCPTIRTVLPDDLAPLDAAIARLRSYDWVIFTSVNGVRFFLERLANLDRSADALRGPCVAAIGPATAEALGGRGVRVDFVPREHVAEAIVDGIGDVRGKYILLPSADIARGTLAEGLGEAGARVDEVIAYRTIAAGERDLSWLSAPDRAVDVATFTSPSTVRNFVAMAGEDQLSRWQQPVVACIGPVTAQAAEAAGLRVSVVAAEQTIAGLIRAVEQYLYQL